jgi:hypothetical protein
VSISAPLEILVYRAGNLFWIRISFEERKLLLKYTPGIGVILIRRAFAWFFSKRNRKRLTLSALNTIVLTSVFAGLGYLAVSYDYGGAVGKALKFFHRVTPEEIEQFEQRMAYDREVSANLNRNQQAQTKRIQELSADLFEDMGLLNVQSGLITLTDGEAAQIRQGNLAGSVEFAAPFWNKVPPSVNIRWKNLVPGEPAPNLKAFNIGYRTFCVIAGRSDKPFFNVRPGAQIYWTAFGSFKEDHKFTPEPPSGCGYRFRNVQPVVSSPRNEGDKATNSDGGSGSFQAR